MLKHVYMFFVFILQINTIQHNIAFKAVEGFHKIQRLFSCHQIDEKLHMIYTVARPGAF